MRHRRLPALALVLALGLGLGMPAAQAAPDWAALTASQQEALAPLKQDWAQIEPARRAKWLEIAARFPGMPEAERWRVQARMAEWARLSPHERRTARLTFQQSRTIEPIARAEKWQAFQSLPEDERRALAQRALPPAGAKTAQAGTAAARPATTAVAKANVVPSQPAPPVKAISPVAQQARPGATTTPITKRPLPPVHHQAGLPKIAATPEFVDPATLLPQRGPQGAAARKTASTDPATQP